MLQHDDFERVLALTDAGTALAFVRLTRSIRVGHGDLEPIVDVESILHALWIENSEALSHCLTAVPIGFQTLLRRALSVIAILP